ncbi:MAG: hypothetical protein U0Q16_39235 [Bryobacteraceae bacterium]
MKSESGENKTSMKCVSTPLARWGFSIWFCLVEYAVKNRLPMRLDY